jgi:hypothetical protein
VSPALATLIDNRATNSLWSTLTSEQVVGPFAGRGVELTTLPVFTGA